MRAFRSPIVTVHEYSFFLLLILIAVHIADAVVDELKEGGALISAMFTGTKVHSREPADAPPPEAPVDPRTRQP